MTDGLPTEEQLQRIRHGVMDRIDRRRRIARRVTRAAVAVLVVGGGVGLIAPALRFGVGSAASGTSAGSGAESAPSVVVRFHATAARGSHVTFAQADPARLPGSAIEACGAVEFQSDSGRTPTGAAPAPSSTSAPAAVLCRDDGGALHVYPSDGSPSTLCARDGMRAVVPR